MPRGPGDSASQRARLSSSGVAVPSSKGRGWVRSRATAGQTWPAGRTAPCGPERAAPGSQLGLGVGELCGAEAQASVHPLQAPARPPLGPTTSGSASRRPRSPGAGPTWAAQEARPESVDLQPKPPSPPRITRPLPPLEGCITSRRSLPAFRSLRGDAVTGAGENSPSCQKQVTLIRRNENNDGLGGTRARKAARPPVGGLGRGALSGTRQAQADSELEALFFSVAEPGVLEGFCPTKS